MGYIKGSIKVCLHQEKARTNAKKYLKKTFPFYVTFYVAFSWGERVLRVYIIVSMVSSLNGLLGTIYTKRQSQCSVNAAMTLATQLSLTTMESLQNGPQPHCQATPLWSMRAVPQASLQC